MGRVKGVDEPERFFEPTDKYQRGSLQITNAVPPTRCE